MKLGEKLRYLRLVEGTLRGMDREMTQQDLVRALKKEMGSGLSQSYLSQIESGARPHLTNASRMLLARFFKVHPGYLVDDPEGYHTELTSDLRATEDRLDLWLINGAEQFARDPELSQALLQVAKHKDTRKCLVLLGAILETPELVERLTEVLKPGAGEPAQRADGGEAGSRRERTYDVGDVLSGVLSGRRDAERAVVPGRKLAPAALSILHVPHGTAHMSHVRMRTRGGSGAEMPFLNFGTITAFLAWFGGTGYLLTRYSSLVVTLVLAWSRSSLGLVGASDRLLVRGEAAAEARSRTRSGGLRPRRSAGAHQQPDSRRAALAKSSSRRRARGTPAAPAARTAKPWRAARRSSSRATSTALPMCGAGKRWRREESS